MSASVHSLFVLQAQEMQVRLTEELSRMQAAAEASENMMDEVYV